MVTSIWRPGAFWVRFYFRNQLLTEDVRMFPGLGLDALFVQVKRGGATGCVPLRTLVSSFSSCEHRSE